MDLSETQAAFVKKIKCFAEQEIAPHVEELENDLELRQQIFVEMDKEGLFSLCLPEQLTQQPLNYLNYILALKEVAKVDAGISVGMSLINMVREAVALYGTNEQIEKYLKNQSYLPLSFALTEKQAGSDAKNIQMQALKKNELYVLNGAKQFITNADRAGFVLVMAKTDPKKGAKGISAFIVEKETKGFNVLKKERKMGLLSANLIDFELVDCQIPEKNILGKEGEGFKIAMQALDGGRLGISAQALGIAEAAYEAALKHAKERIQFGKPLAENQVIAFKLADMYIKLQAGMGLLEKACLQKNEGKDINLSASIAKVFCTEAANEIVNEALQIFGGYGYIKDNPIERYYRDVRVTTLYEGTSEIQRLIIAKNILR